MKTALVTGINGQDGSYLAELLLSKGYKVYGLIRRKSKMDLSNIEHLVSKTELIYGDMTDIVSLYNAIKTSWPDEVYNLAAQSFVASSWDQPITTLEIDGLGVAGILEAIRYVKPDARFYQASSSEMFGKASETPQNESTPFYPRSPYGIAKLCGHWIAKNYRESYGLYTVSGICFNHESERRGKEFVTRKITDAVARIGTGLQDRLELGNLDAKRDWGHAEDYVQGMWLMLQQAQPDDYVIATGEMHSVREFVELAFRVINVDVTFLGEGVEEKGICSKTGKVLVEVNPRFFRLAEVDMLCGDATKALEELGWTRKVTFQELVTRMVKADCVRVCRS